MSNFKKSLTLLFLTLLPFMVSADCFTDNKNGTVSDSKTGLMWKKCSEGQSGVNCSGNAEKYQWRIAMQHAQTVGFAGYSDWRLPNINELESIASAVISDEEVKKLNIAKIKHAIDETKKDIERAEQLANAHFNPFDIPTPGELFNKLTGGRSDYEETMNKHIESLNERIAVLESTPTPLPTCVNNVAVFPNMPLNWFWSSSTQPTNNGGYFFPIFFDFIDRSSGVTSSITTADDENSKFNVLLVRNVQ